MVHSLYIHIPFCRRKCLYCDFYSRLYDEPRASDYIEVLSEQIAKLGNGFSTIYIGGGTPTVLHNDSLNMLLAGLKRFAGKVSEFTIEANPESIDEEKVKILLDAGVNRISIGVQSLDERKLKRLGRIHNARKAEEAVALCAKKGFKEISVDLIFGLWDETTEGWKRELERIVKLPVSHISCYSLSYEKNTPLFSAMKNKSFKPLDDATVASMYEMAIDNLSLRGFKQYEVSNFAKAGHECRHNLNYWENNPYIGLGASAVSYIDGTRSKNVSDADEYVRRFKDGRPLVGSSEKLSPIKMARETAAIKVRTKKGIDFVWFKAKTGFELQELEKKALPHLVEDGLIKYKKDGESITGISLKRKGFLFCDTVSSALL